MPKTTREDEKHFMETYQAWPLYPFLPIKRRKKNSTPDCAVLFHPSLNDKRLIFINVSYDFYDEIKVELSKVSDATSGVSIDKLLDEGWIVD